MFRKLPPVLLAALLPACTWVNVDPAAQEVMVLPAKRVANCEKLGTTDVRVAEEVGFISRVEEDVAADLANLARNEAVSMGGDTVAPLTEIRKGKQTFGIYRCIPKDATERALSPAQDEAESDGVETIPYRNN